jgi:LysR family transcriptional regulator, low CO2-responsive transcriptional regulator
MNPGPLPHLETFSKAAELSSFTGAARALGLTQAAVSQRVHLLEQAVGTPLFRRQAGRVLLTDAGHRLYPYAQRIAALHREARQAVTGHKVPVTGDLLLAASSIPGEHLLPKPLSAFRRRHPHVQVRVTVTDSAAVLNQVEHGQAHLGLVGRREDSPHLEFQPFARDELVLVAPAKHRLARRNRVSLEELCAQPLILREIGSGSRRCLEQALTQAGKSPRDLHVVLELGSNEGIKEAVQRGIGLAVLSTYAVPRQRRAGGLHVLRVAGLPLEREFFIVRDRRRVLPIPAQLFLDFLAPYAHAHPAP